MTSERFHFDIDGGDYSLPRNISFGVLRKSRGLDPLSQFSFLLESVADEDTLAALDALEPAEVVAKLKGWLGAPVGESSRSSS